MIWRTGSIYLTAATGGIRECVDVLLKRLLKTNGCSSSWLAQLTPCGSQQDTPVHRPVWVCFSWFSPLSSMRGNCNAAQTMICLKTVSKSLQPGSVEIGGCYSSIFNARCPDVHLISNIVLQLLAVLLVGLSLGIAASFSTAPQWCGLMQRLFNATKTIPPLV